jgi:hypothetical protein
VAQSSGVTLWEDTRVDPIEIALPGGVGYTLRAYRPRRDVVPPEIDRDAHLARDDFAAAAASVAARRTSNMAQDELDEDEEPVNHEDAAEVDADDTDDEVEDDEDDEDDEDTGDEEIPVFLGHRGRLLLFHSAEKLVEYAASGAEHDLTQLDTWSQLAGRMRASDISPADQDRYELDLVVENLRGGPDAWEPTIIVKAGEIARDLGYALRLEPVLSALAPGSPLDDLDEAIRVAQEGGLRALVGKRRLRKLGGQGSALAWRTIIGKISAAVDWRD